MDREQDIMEEDVHPMAVGAAAELEAELEARRRQYAHYRDSLLDFAERGRLLDQTLEVCWALWTTSPTSYDGPGLTFAGIHQMPKPIQAGGVPIWVSGRSTNRLVRERVARFGAGWIPWGDDADDPVSGIARIRAAMVDAGRGTDPLDVAGTLPSSMDDVPALVEAGITDFRVTTKLPPDEAEAGAVLQDIDQQFRATVGRTT